MAQTQNYNRTCQTCNGEGIRAIWGRGFLGLWRKLEGMASCSKCNGTGVEIPKRIIHWQDKAEPEITY